MKILISPYSKKTPSNKESVKNYPFWDELVNLLKEKGHYICQAGVGSEKKLLVNRHLFDLSFSDLKKELLNCDLWISVDSFFQHFAYFHKKSGIVIFSQSDPNIFGHKENTNILVSRKYLRKNQFDYWGDEPFIIDSYPKPEVVLKYVDDFTVNNG